MPTKITPLRLGTSKAGCVVQTQIDAYNYVYVFVVTLLLNSGCIDMSWKAFGTLAVLEFKRKGPTRYRQRVKNTKGLIGIYALLNKSGGSIMGLHQIIVNHKKKRWLTCLSLTQCQTDIKIKCLRWREHQMISHIHWDDTPMNHWWYTRALLARYSIYCMHNAVQCVFRISESIRSQWKIAALLKQCVSDYDVRTQWSDTKENTTTTTFIRTKRITSSSGEQ